MTQGPGLATRCGNCVDFSSILFGERRYINFVGRKYFFNYKYDKKDLHVCCGTKERNIVSICCFVCPTPPLPLRTAPIPDQSCTYKQMDNASIPIPSLGIGVSN